MAAPLPRPVKRVLRPAASRFRYATRQRRILPSFLIIGAQRAGTTSLFNYLLGHPGVAGPSGGDAAVWWTKETHFFDEKFSKGTDWYRAFFPLASTRERCRKHGGELLAGEATPYYMFHPAVPARVARTLPDVKLIALLRNPVERPLLALPDDVTHRTREPRFRGGARRRARDGSQGPRRRS